MGRFITRDIWEGDVSSPMSFNRWMYVEGNPINFTDPTGLCGNPGEPPCPDWWVNQTQLYIDGLGYLDSGHIDRGWRHAHFFVENIESVLKRGRNSGAMLRLPRATSGDEYWVDYAVSARIRDDQVNSVAYGMLMDFERGYEEYQNRIFFPRYLNGKILLPQFLSGFAPADFPSDHLGFWAYMNGFERNDIPGLLECLGEVKILFPQLLGIVVDSYGIPENHEFLPMIRETVRLGRSTVYRTTNIAWPTDFEIQPIPSGPNTWQVWNRSH